MVFTESLHTIYILPTKALFLQIWDTAGCYLILLILNTFALGQNRETYCNTWNIYQTKIKRRKTMLIMEPNVLCKYNVQLILLIAMVSHPSSSWKLHLWTHFMHAFMPSSILNAKSLNNILENNFIQGQDRNLFSCLYKNMSKCFWQQYYEVWCSFYLGKFVIICKGKVFVFPQKVPISLN